MHTKRLLALLLAALLLTACAGDTTETTDTETTPETTYIDFNGIYEFGGLLGTVNGAIFYDRPYASAYAAAEEKANAALEKFMEILA